MGFISYSFGVFSAYTRIHLAKMSTWSPMPTKSYIYCMRANMVAMIQKFGMHWAIYSINRQRLSANKMHLCKFENKVKTMSIWWICIVSRPQTTLISQWGLHTFIPLQWRHNQHHGVSNHRRVSISYSTVCLGADPRKHQSSASLAFVREFTGDRWNPGTQVQ